MSERSMTRKWHGKALLMAIRRIDSFVDGGAITKSPCLTAAQLMTLLRCQ